MNPKEMDRFRKLLDEERKRVLEELGWVEENYVGKAREDSAGGVSAYSVHPSEGASDSMEMEKAYMIGASSGGVLEDIDEALASIDDGSYGKCEECGEDISVARLEAVPYAKLCIKCKTSRENSEGATR
ncbi:MAG: TraR/DksA C4-type zinc finger protein [Candidatus Eisenbacteria bacterium]